MGLVILHTLLQLLWLALQGLNVFVHILARSIVHLDGTGNVQKTSSPELR